ncbi:MAG: nucleoside deaminase [Desulfobulbaceae bacterium]|uniref:Nucleoside deaminase n=1 Tax=Candidatus Desulfobia pelagia TaxID=2841692 RepID=A0A8J6NDE6_9BACT|nr:nucleoside deaminase [Candidatus Desulfobia pelagia]
MAERHEHYMKIALEQAETALNNGEFPVGCILVHDNTIVGQGCREHSLLVDRNELDHAEILAIRDMNSRFPDLDPSGITAYTTLEPCLMCYGALLINQISAIVYAFEDAMGGGINLPLAHLTPLYRNMEVSIFPNVMRRESLNLFKAFFQSPSCSYLQNTYLAEYTLSQE